MKYGPILYSYKPTTLAGNTSPAFSIVKSTLNKLENLFKYIELHYFKSFLQISLPGITNLKNCNRWCTETLKLNDEII